MGRLFKLVFYLVVLAALGVVGFAVFSDLPAPQDTVVVPIDTPGE